MDGKPRLLYQFRRQTKRCYSFASILPSSRFWPTAVMLTVPALCVGAQ